MELLLTLICILVALNLVATVVNKWFRREDTKRFTSQVAELAEKVKYPLVQMPAPQIVDLGSLESSLAVLPNKVLQSIQGSVNVHKGVLGELIGYIQLRAQYDRIIPLGSIVDFLALKLPTDESSGMVYFVDIKTGKSARLSKDQRAFKSLIENKQVQFVQYKICDLGVKYNGDQK